MKAPKGRARFSGGGASGRRAEVLRAIAAARGLTSTEKLVLFTIEAHVGYADRDTGRAWPSVATVAACCAKSDRWVRLALVRLRTAGWVKVEPRGAKGAQMTNVYTVTPVEPRGTTDEPAPLH